MTSQLQAPPLAPFQNQLIIMEPRGQTLSCECLVIVTDQSEGREYFVIPSNQLSGSQLAVFSSSSPADPVVDVPVTTVTDDSTSSSGAPSEQTAATSRLDVSAPTKTLSSDAPSWALRLRSMEKLGDSYRGFCCSGAEVEAILLLHKQETSCVFGTRQSPSLDKPATRLMWKSQYVPYDGIPFVNAGNEARRSKKMRIGFSYFLMIYYSSFFKSVFVLSVCLK
ncbi:calcium-responsive transcription factor-like isoform X2 [Seriola lalandi dorsalis]|uniref:calcium-responsive transcription factor-like isoform X2 n=1 Tax=Seriola lalandi dorsalis TaxID=1841481 RepID=UPI000C6F88EE|nr:calcium-responsive transcription factor-like isoform X2 [Seriola lalandi dorsalis]